MYANKYPGNVGRFVLDAILPAGIVSLMYCDFDRPRTHQILAEARVTWNLTPTK